MRGISRSLTSVLLVTALSAIAPPALGAECGALKLVTALDMTMLPSGRPAVPAMIGDRAQTMMVDTGGAFSQVTRRTVREYNLTTSIARARSALRSTTGELSDRVVRLPLFIIGDMRQENASFFVSPGADDPNDTTPAEFAGLIAPDFLQNFDVDFDFALNKLNLFSPDHCEGKVVYWQAPAVAVVPMRVTQRQTPGAGGVRRGRPNASSVIERQDIGDITIRIVLDGRQMEAGLDTGAASTSLDLDVARRQFDVDVNAADVEKAGEVKGVGMVYRRRFKSLSIEGVTVANPMLELAPDLVSAGGRTTQQTGSLIRRESPPVVLGMSTLSKLHVYIAYKERKLYITAASSAPAAP